MPARLAVENRGSYLAYTPEGEVWAEISGRFRHRVTVRSELPTVGDWVALRPSDNGPALITHLFERRTKFSRKQSGDRYDIDSDRIARVEEQIIASNIDRLFVVSALTDEFNSRRIERYLTMAWEGGSVPVLVLNKSDLTDPAPKLEQAASSCPGVEIITTSTINGDGIDGLRSYLVAGTTGALVGSSGVGKTSLINSLIQDSDRAVQPTRDDDRGRHTTSRRELVRLPGGGYLIDTPGLRELQLWTTNDGLSTAFDEISELATGCRFRDCTHMHEPGCVVMAALESGGLEQDRYDSYRKLQREAERLVRKQDPMLRREELRRWKAISKSMRDAKPGRH
ncbi:MAG TPA: ribosome small subunit-dependent GTPase A [Actinomycetota bacterium]|nr:ribosome small subunit-dependent GTPase A [Actinomycetota bacterium]